ncbi:MAG: glutamyl-tRNA reductase [Verrucomicrobia bacterium]|jgi:glutamyl-tRNA reductase|nr:MAG: glutamyl-tRNA reductase [Verrucomicrobiota bacterium]
MNLICLGISHQTAPVEIRERMAFAEKELPDALRDLVSLEGLQEAVVLNTCNRVEVYAVAEHAGNGFAGMENYFRRRFDLAEGDDLPFYRKSDREGAVHLFRVASGLESMVLGETEIFGQVKKAYATAQSVGTTSRVLNKLFQQSFQVGKHLRNNTQIQRGSTSVGSVAVDLAEKVFGDLKRCHVMLIGAGDMSRVVAQSLLSRGACSVIVSNRSHDRAVELAEAIGGEAIRFDDWESRVPGTDIIISSTSAPHIVIHAEAIAAAMKSRRGRPLIVIDIAVPRDVDPLVARIPDVYLYPIDALSQIADAARRKRETQIRQCDQVLHKYLEEKGIAALESVPPTYSPVRAEQGGTAG